MRFSYAALSLLLRTCSAVFADEAWKTDWHYALLGEPQESTTFFHRPSADSRASLVYTLSEQHVLGALNPKDGSVVWRQRLSLPPSSSTNDSFLRAVDGSDVVVSSLGNILAGRSAADGRLAWTYSVPGAVKDVEIFEFDDNKDAIVLYADSGAEVERIDAQTGAVKWHCKADASDIPYQLSVSSTTIYVVLLHKTLLGYIKLKVVSIAPLSGRIRDEYTLSSDNELAKADNILTVGANSASPIVAWTDTANTTIKINVLGSKGISTFSIKSASGQPVTSVKLHAPFHANSLSHFLIHYSTAEDNWAEVFHIDSKSGKIDKAYKLPSLRDESTFSTSTSGANVYFTRISKYEVSVVSSVSHGILGKWEMASSLSSYGQSAVVPHFAVTEVSLKDGKVSAVRSAVWQSQGELILLRDGSRVWARPEALAGTVKASFAIPEAVKKLDSAVSRARSSNYLATYLHRLREHQFALTKAFGGPVWLQELFSSLWSNTGSTTVEAFGFDKTVICETSKGVVYGLDVSKAGKVLYSYPGNASHSDTGLGVGGSAASSAISYERVGDHLEAFLRADASRTPIWKFIPEQGENMIEVIPRPEDDPVASIGVVLGDRKVLYKYLNTNLALILTANVGANTLSARIIDTVSGDLLHASTHLGIDLSLPVAAVLTENWFAYTFTADSSDVSPKGAQLVSGELYESAFADDRGLLDTKTNYSSLASNVMPTVLTSVYHISEPISKLAVTKTRQSITTRQLLAILPESDSIVGIPRAAIDPRRPHRDPTKDEQMEGLVKYTPNLDFDPKWYLNHKRDLLGVDNVIASPALLESTSIIFAYGLDIFGTRLSPSFNFDMLGKDFNKFQMLSTVLALAVGTVLVAPLVARKQVNARWSLHS